MQGALGHLRLKINKQYVLLISLNKHSLYLNCNYTSYNRNNPISFLNREIGYTHWIFWPSNWCLTEVFCYSGPNDSINFFQKAVIKTPRMTPA